MDNKITKARFSHFMSNFWLLTAVAIAGIIFFWALLFSMTTVKLTVGQKFYYFYDLNFDFSKYEYFRTKVENDKIFSFDVLTFGCQLIDDTNTITLKNSIYEVDAIFSSTAKFDNDGYLESRANFLVDYFNVYSLTELYNANVKYLNKFLKDGEESIATDFDYQRLDESKILSNLKKRLAKDNRYRAGEIKNEQEFLRIQSLVLNLKDFKKILDYGESNDIFYKYTKFEQAKEHPLSPSMKQDYENAYNMQQEKNYGLILDVLPTNNTKPILSDSFSLTETRLSTLTEEGKPNHTVLMIFNYLSQQPDLQFETVAFINETVRTFSTLLD